MIVKKREEQTNSLKGRPAYGERSSPARGETKKILFTGSGEA